MFKKGIERSKIVSALEGSNIQIRMLFAGDLIKHFCFDEMRKDKDRYRVIGDLHNADRTMRDTFCISVYPGMKNEMLEEMVRQIVSAV